MACNPTISAAQKQALEKQVDNLLAQSGVVNNGYMAGKIKTLLDAATAGHTTPIKTVKQIIVAGLEAQDNQTTILAAVKSAFPDSKAGPSDIAYYKSKLKKAKLQGVTGLGPVKTKPAVQLPQTSPALYSLNSMSYKLGTKGVPLNGIIELEQAVKKRAALTGQNLDKVAHDLDQIVDQALTGSSFAVDFLETVLEDIDLTAIGGMKKITALKKTLKHKLQGIGGEIDADILIPDQVTELQSLFAAGLDDTKLLLELDKSFIIDWYPTAKAKIAEAKKLIHVFDNAAPTSAADVFNIGIKQGKPPEEIREVLQKFFPTAKAAADDKSFKNAYAYYKTQLKKLGELPGQQAAVAAPLPPGSTYTPVAARPLGPLAPARSVDADTVLGGQKLADATGSNPGGVYMGKDGVKRYVKFYDDPSQAYGEHVSNQLYRQLGLHAPESGVVVQNGKTIYWSRYLDGPVTPVKSGMLEDTANKILDGFAADVLTANWDAIGLSFDNVVMHGGKIVRVDQGGSLLFRAQKSRRKDAGLLMQISEWDKFVDGSTNASYASVFSRASMTPMNLGKRVIDQIDAIEALEKSLGGGMTGWTKLVEQLAPDMPIKDRDQVVFMLSQRAQLLYAKRLEVTNWLRTAAQRQANQAVAFREVDLRIAAVVDDDVDKKMRRAVQETFNAIKGQVPIPKSLGGSPGFAFQQRMQALRKQLLREELADLSDAEFNDLYQKMDSRYGSWYGSSSSDGAGVLKRAAEEEFGTPTVFHGYYFDHDTAKRNAYFPPKPVSAVMKRFMRAEQKISRAMIRELFNDAKTVKIYRGVHQSYFTSAGARVPGLGEEFVDVGNSLASWSFKKLSFGNVGMEAEVPVEDLFNIFFANQQAHGSENEVFVIGRPLRVKRFR